MIDLHCHILPGIDDGAKTFDESLTILKNAADAGVIAMALTPHYIKGSRYNADNVQKSALLQQLRNLAANAGLSLQLYLGNELFLDANLLPLIQSGQIASLNGSRYLLIELPMRAELKNATDLLFEIISAGFVPVIAHPERYEYFQNDLAKIQPFLDIGCLMQGDDQALRGRYGRSAQKALKKFLERGQIHLLASDTHHSTDDYQLQIAYDKIAKITKDSTAAEHLFTETPLKILRNEPV